MTLYATDLDGTLLDANARLSDTTARMMRSLIDRGVMVTFITARTPATVEPILQSAMPRIPGVAMTGATLWNPSTRLYESVTYHRQSDVATIAEICRQAGVTPFVYTLPPGDNTLRVFHDAQTLTPIEREFVEERTINDLKTFHLRTPYPADAETHTVLFFAMGEPARIEAAAKAICEATDCYASCYPDTYHEGLALLEVFACGVSKANGLLNLKRCVGADRTVVFGDNLNDIPMLQVADVAVAVDNAHPDVKAVADIVIGPNTDDSVVKYITEQTQ